MSVRQSKMNVSEEVARLRRLRAEWAATVYPRLESGRRTWQLFRHEMDPDTQRHVLVLTRIRSKKFRREIDLETVASLMDEIALDPAHPKRRNLAWDDFIRIAWCRECGVRLRQLAAFID